MTDRDDADRPHVYREIAAKMEHMIEQGLYGPGARMPSIRELGRQLRVGVNTVKQAYVRLEDARIIEARPRSGYYVSCRSEPSARSTATRRENSELVASHVVLPVGRNARDGGRASAL